MSIYMLFQDMGHSQRSELVQRTLEPRSEKSRLRREEIADRVACLEERSDELARERITDWFEPVYGNEVVKFTTPIWNPLLNITHKIAQGYANPPIRRLVDVESEVEAAFLKLLEGPTRFNSKCRAWNQKSVALNTIVVLVLPRFRRTGEACFDFVVVHGAAAEVVQDPRAPFGDTPLLLSYALQRREDRYLSPQEEIVCVVDAMAYHYCDQTGNVLRTVPHNLGMFPGSVLRSCDPDGQDDDDWWNWRPGSILVGATKDQGAVGAIKSWARKTQFGKLITIARHGETADPEPEQENGQTLGTPTAVADVTGADIEVEDYEAPIEGFLKDLEAIEAQAAKRTTGSSTILDDGQLSAEEAAQRHAVLLQLQRDQHAYLGPFEQDIMHVMARTAELHGIKDFPTVEQIKAFETQFVPLTFVSTPEAELKMAIDATRFGVFNQVRWMQKQYGYSEEDAQAEIMAMAEQRAVLHAFQAARNLPSDAEGELAVNDPKPPAKIISESDPALPGERPEAMTGRVGGRAVPTANGE